ncbi:2720_t:CDS:2, partial [Cetraspora pellucida]
MFYSLILSGIETSLKKFIENLSITSTNYKILDPPPGYVPIRTPARKLMATPTSMGGMLEEGRNQTYDLLAEIPVEGTQYYARLLKIKNGTSPMRKASLRQITDKAQDS